MAQIKLKDNHVWPRDKRASMVFFADWIESMQLMSDTDFRAAIMAAVAYGTEGFNLEEIQAYIGSMSDDVNKSLVLYWLMGIKGSIDRPYDEWQRMRNGAKKKQERMEKYENIPTEK